MNLFFLAIIKRTKVLRVRYMTSPTLKTSIAAI